MRPLTEEETKVFFEKLSKYIGDNIKSLIDRSDGTYCFRLHRERVYYVSEKIMKQVRNFLFKIFFLTIFSKFVKLCLRLIPFILTIFPQKNSKLDFLKKNRETLFTLIKGKFLSF